MNLRVLRIPTLGNAMAGNIFFWLVVGAIPFLLTLLFQDVFGWSPVKAGAVVIGVFVGNIAIKPFTTPLLNRFGFRPVLITATMLLAVTAVLSGFLRRDADPGHRGPGGDQRRGALDRADRYSTIAFSDVPPDRMRDANTLAGDRRAARVGLGIAAATVALRLGVPIGGN